MRHLRVITGLLCAALLSCLTQSLKADVSAAVLFNDSMVLQRDIKLPVWGWAKPGEAVTVKFADHEEKTQADAQGKWRVNLPAMPASTTPREMTIAGPTNTITIKDVVVGDVWICSGQSNMVWQVRQTLNPEQDIATANDPMMRMITIEYASGEDQGVKILPTFKDKLYAIRPQEKAIGTWKVTNPKNVINFSGVGYFFGRQLRQKMSDVPIGLITTCQGATAIESWTSLEGLKAIPVYRERAESFERLANAYTASPNQAAVDAALAVEQQKKLERDKVWFAKLDEIDTGLREKWMNPSLDVSSWSEIKLPVTQENNPLGVPMASIWFRKDVEIPAAWSGKELVLSLGEVDAVDEVFVNGQRVGKTWFDTAAYWTEKRTYAVPAALVKDTKISLVMRLLKVTHPMSPRGPADLMTLSPKETIEGATPVSLAGAWVMKKSNDLSPADQPMVFPLEKNTVPGGHYGHPGAQYNGMIAPLIPYGIRGAIWYQGEANAPFYIEYRQMLPGLIKSWRKEWGQGDFHFGVVHLADYWEQQTKPVQPNVGYHSIREAQMMAMVLPNTFQATAVGVGEGGNIHPKNKQEVGRRLGIAALGVVYGQKGKVWTGPTYKSMKIEGDKIRLTFDQAAGLHAQGDPPVGFAIAGADRVFYFGKAKIEGEQVVVWSEKVPNPVAVRYAWATNPVCNLYNELELPMFQFRTDEWDYAQIIVGKDEITIPTGWVPKK